MKLFASSLIGKAKGWVDQFPEKSIKNVEELQKAFRVRWCDREHSQDLYSQYYSICKGPCENTRDFTDRFNFALKKIWLKVGLEQAIIDQYLSSLEGTLQFEVKSRSPTNLEEAQDMVFQVERNLDFDDYIEQGNMNCELWDPGNENMAEPEPPSVLQVEPASAKRKWSLSPKSDISSQEPPLKKAHPKGKDGDVSHKGLDPNPIQDFSLFIHQVGDPIPRSCEFKTFYVSLRVNDLLLHNCLLHPESKANIMTKEVM
jgi:hypothetical protein